MTNIRGLKRIFSIFLILFITTVSTQNLSPALCGGLHSGVDVCKECSDGQTSLVRSQPLPKPLIVDSATTVNQMKSRTNQALKHGLKFLRSRPQISSRRNKAQLKTSLVTETKPTNFEGSIQYAPQIQHTSRNQRPIATMQQVQLSTPSHQPVQLSASPYQPVQSSASPYQPVQLSASPYQPVQSSASPYQPIQLSASPYQPVQLSASPYQQVQSSASPYQQVQLSTSPYQQVPNIDPSVKLAPRFYPVGDPCFKKGRRPEPNNRLLETTIIAPANQPKIECYTESSPVMRLGSTEMLNTMPRSQMISDQSIDQIPQLSSGSFRTQFRLNNSRRYKKLRGGPIERTLSVNPVGNNVRMRDYAVNLNAQNSNPIQTDRLRSNAMSSNVMIDNTMNRGWNNAYRGNLVFGAAPTNNEAPRISYLSPQRGPIFGSSAGLVLNNQEEFYKEEPGSPISLNKPADMVSVNLKMNEVIKSLQKVATSGEINPMSSTKISEDKLSYGPQTTPINDQIEVALKEIPEEKLHIVEKPVIELNLNRPSATSRTFEEPTKLISYSDLGFKEKTFESPRFQDRPAVFEAPTSTNNLKQSISAEAGPEHLLRYPVAETTVVGQLVPSKPLSLDYVPTNPHFTSSAVDNSVLRRISPTRSYYPNINGQHLPSYSGSNQHVGQLIHNNQMLPSSRNQEICYCT